MNKKLLSLSIVLAILGCKNIDAMRQVQDPELVLCNENDRHAVRLIVVERAGNSSGTILQNGTGNPNIRAILSCVHNVSNVMYDLFDDGNKFMLNHTSDDGVYDLPVTENGADVYKHYAFEYMSDVDYSMTRGGYIIDRYDNRHKDSCVKFVVSDIRDGFPRNIFTSLGHMQLCPYCMTPRAQQLPDLYENLEPNRVHPLWRMQNKIYTIRLPKIYMPFDISVSFAEKAGPINIIESVLPTADEINAWRGRDLQVTAYGFPSFDLRHEYKFTIPCRLTENGRWIHSIDDYSVDFAIRTLGMSGGPCFVNGKLCGVLSGAKVKGDVQQLYIKTIPQCLIDLVNSFEHR